MQYEVISHDAVKENVFTLHMKYYLFYLFFLLLMVLLSCRFF
jgi:hypothetical protein